MLGRGRAGRPVVTGRRASDRITIRKRKRPRGVCSGRYSSMINWQVKRAACQTEITRGFDGLLQVASDGGFRQGWLPQSGFPGFRKRIQRADVVIP